MIGLLIITHESIGEAYRSLAQYFFSHGTPENIHILGVQPDEDQDDIINNAIMKLRESPKNHGALIMTDIFGVIPCNVARRTVRADKSAILTGLNVPMLIKATQHSPIAEHLNAFTDMVKEVAVRGTFAITAEPEDLVCKKLSERIKGAPKSLQLPPTPPEHTHIRLSERNRMLKQSVGIINKLGPHAHVSSKFTQTASQLKCEVRVIKNGSRASGKSIMGLMMLAAAKGTVIGLGTDGADEAVAMQALTDLINDYFGEGKQ